MLDQSALTGESMPARLDRGQDVMSGSTNAGDAFDLEVTRRAADSTYAGIVRLVEEAQRSKAPMARLADRYSLLFLAVTVALATAAWWFTGDPIRAVAVLVVATPCPLILAVPVALVAGLSRAAHFGVLIKGAKPLEALARIQTLILDKTGTLTEGRPQIVSIDTHGDMSEQEVLYFAAALDQASKHPIAQAIVAAAHARGIVLPVPEQIVETPGEGVAGSIGGRKVLVGGTDFITDAGWLIRSGQTVPGSRFGARSPRCGRKTERSSRDGRRAAIRDFGTSCRTASARYRAHSPGDGRSPCRGRRCDQGPRGSMRSGPILLPTRRCSWS